MKVFKIISITVIVLVVAIGVTFFLIGYLKPKPAGIAVRSIPEAAVYIDGKFVGKTPVDTTLEPESISLKVVPEVGVGQYDAKINLVSGVKTIVKREFGETEASSSGEIVSFEKETEENSTGLTVVSTPDNAQVELDGVSRGFSPIKLSSVVPGEHQLTVKAPGYGDRGLTLRTVAGYRLTVTVQLAKLPDEPKDEEKTEAVIYINILETPTGFLRVRLLPGSGGAEIDQVNPGSRYPLLEIDEETGWYKIQLEKPAAGLPEGRSGWVSNQYATQSAETISQ